MYSEFTYRHASQGGVPFSASRATGSAPVAGGMGGAGVCVSPHPHDSLSRGCTTECDDASIVPSDPQVAPSVVFIVFGCRSGPGYSSGGSSPEMGGYSGHPAPMGRVLHAASFLHCLVFHVAGLN